VCVLAGWFTVFESDVQEFSDFSLRSSTGAVLGIFIWVSQSKARHILGRTTGVVYMGIMWMTRAV